MFIERISPSKSNIIDQCLYKYHARYILRIPGDQAKNEDTLKFGSYIHKIFELGINNNKVKELKVIAEDIRPTYKIKEKYDNKLTTCIENFIKLNSKLSKTLSTELEFTVPLDEENKIFSTGIIDRIVEGSKGGILIIDYKTSEKEMKRLDLINDKQMQAYVHAVHKLYNVPIHMIDCGHFYPLTGNLITVKIPESMINNWKKKEISRVWAIRKKTKDEFPPMKNIYCSNCEYREMCPAQVSPEQVLCRINEQIEKKKLEDAKP